MKHLGMENLRHMKDSWAEIMVLPPLRPKLKQCHQIVTKTTILNAFPPQPGEVYTSQNINGHICMMLKLGTQHHDHGHPKILCLILPGKSLAWELAYFKDNFLPCGVKQHTIASCRGNFVTVSPFWSLDFASFTFMLNLC